MTPKRRTIAKCDTLRGTGSSESAQPRSVEFGWRQTPSAGKQKLAATSPSWRWERAHSVVEVSH